MLRYDSDAIAIVFMLILRMLSVGKEGESKLYQDRRARTRCWEAESCFPFWAKGWLCLAAKHCQFASRLESFLQQILKAR
jgi:hypothetical protein